MTELLERPHMDKKIQELESLAVHDWDDSSALFRIYSELTYRKSKQRNDDLKDRIRGRMEEMYFDWPSTNAQGGDGMLSGSRWEKEGLLAYLGYHVGDSGESMGHRRSILDSAYENPLPELNDRSYMAEWGDPNTAARLQKIARSIAAFCRNQKRKSGTSHSSVGDWEADLAYLKWKFYDGRYGFIWPRLDEDSAVYQ